MNPHESRQEQRRARLESAAFRARSESNARFSAASAIGSAIPFGQPILVGHHSERRHRRDAERIDRNMRASVAAEKRAEELDRKAAAVGTAGISSDDPEATEKLSSKTAELEAERDEMKRVNRAYSAGGWDAVAALVTPAQVEKLKRNMSLCAWEKLPYPSYALTNIGARIRQAKAREASIAQSVAAPAREPVIGDGWTITEDRELNRVQIRFDERCSVEQARTLKSRGFRWAPSVGVWQRQLTISAWAAAMMPCAEPAEEMT